MHSSNDGADFRCEPVVPAFEGPIHFGDEFAERDLGVFRPHLRQKVVKENVDDDPRKAPSRWAEELFRSEENFVAVGEVVDGPVEDDSLDQLGWQPVPQAFRSATNKVTEQSTYAGSVGRPCEMEVGEEVQGLLSS